MKTGSTPAETLHLNAWEIGDIIQKTYLHSGDVKTILITRIGEENFLYREKHTEKYGMEQAEFGGILLCNGWEKIGEDKERKSAAGFWGRVAANMTTKIRSVEETVEKDGIMREEFEAWRKSLNGKGAVSATTFMVLPAFIAGFVAAYKKLKN